MYEVLQKDNQWHLYQRHGKGDMIFVASFIKADEAHIACSGLNNFGERTRTTVKNPSGSVKGDIMYRVLSDIMNYMERAYFNNNHLSWTVHSVLDASNKTTGGMEFHLSIMPAAPKE